MKLALAREELQRSLRSLFRWLAVGVCECAFALTRIANRNWRRGWLGASKEAAENGRHLGSIYKSIADSCVMLSDGW
jgi:hypothetical protein